MLTSLIADIIFFSASSAGLSGRALECSGVRPEALGLFAADIILRSFGEAGTILRVAIARGPSTTADIKSRQNKKAGG